MELLILILGVCSSITLIISALSTGRQRMLVFAMTTSVLCLVQYALNNSTLALIIGCIGLVRSLFALLSLKYPILNGWQFLLVFLGAHTTAFLLTTDWNNFSIVASLPVLGAYLGTLAVFFKRMAITKGFMIACGMVWLVYEFYAGFYTQMIGETFTLFANAFALFMVLKAEKAGIKDEDFGAIDEQVIGAITGSIPVVAVKEALTGSIPVIKVPSDTAQLPVIPVAAKSFPETGSVPQVA